jgi:hypothetical protein
MRADSQPSSSLPFSAPAPAGSGQGMDAAALWGSDPDEQRTAVESGSEAAALGDSDGLYPARTDRSGNPMAS